MTRETRSTRTPCLLNRLSGVADDDDDDDTADVAVDDKLSLVTSSPFWLESLIQNAVFEVARHVSVSARPSTCRDGLSVYLLSGSIVFIKLYGCVLR